jgi:hypothetical protein
MGKPMSDDRYYMVEAEFDAYAGNFEVEMTAWAFGVNTEYQQSRAERYFDRPHRDAMLWAVHPDEYGGSLYWQTHDEYGLVWVTIGGHNEYGHGTSMYWRLEDEPNSAEWKALRDAIESFPRDGLFPSSDLPNRLLSLSLTRVETTRTKVR